MWRFGGEGFPRPRVVTASGSPFRPHRMARQRFGASEFLVLRRRPAFRRTQVDLIHAGARCRHRDLQAIVHHGRLVTRIHQLGNVLRQAENLELAGRQFPSRRELRQRVGLVYRGVDIRMQSIMRVPWQLRQGDNVLWYSEDDTVPDKFAWLEDLPDYIGLIEACLCLTSQSFLYKQSNRAGVRGLQWFSPLSVAPEWDESAGLKHFERRLSSRVDYYKPEDIVYVWRRDPLHETMPDTAPAQAAMASANVLYSIDQFVTGFFQRGAIKPMLLQVPQNTPQAERDKVKAWWDRFFSGVKDAWRTNVVTTEVKPVIVGEGLESLTNETLTQERRDDVATAIGVPHSLLFSNSANYATAKQDEQNFYTMTILPDVRLIQKQLNAQLFKALGLQLRFMPNEMDVFQEDEAARAQSFATYVGAGMKQSVAAQILGVELPDGVEYADLDPEPPPPVIMQAPPQQATHRVRLSHGAPPRPPLRRHSHRQGCCVTPLTKVGYPEC